MKFLTCLIVVMGVVFAGGISEMPVQQQKAQAEQAIDLQLHKSVSQINSYESFVREISAQATPETKISLLKQAYSNGSVDFKTLGVEKSPLSTWSQEKFENSVSLLNTKKIAVVCEVERSLRALKSHNSPKYVSMRSLLERTFATRVAEMSPKVVLLNVELSKAISHQSRYISGLEIFSVETRKFYSLNSWKKSNPVEIRTAAPEAVKFYAHKATPEQCNMMSRYALEISLQALRSSVIENSFSAQQTEKKMERISQFSKALNVVCAKAWSNETISLTESRQLERIVNAFVNTPSHEQKISLK